MLIHTLLSVFAAPASLLFAPIPYGGWEPGIGDPTIMGWVTVVAYFAAAWVCWMAARLNGQAVPRVRRFWKALAVLMCALGVNKQLDLQSAMTDIGRWMAFKQGWYEQRHEVQKMMIVVVGVGGLLGLVGIVWFLRRWSRFEMLALIGLVFLLAFIVIRASSFHHVDLMINVRILGARLNWILELGGISIIALAAGSAAGWRFWPFRRAPEREA